MKSIQEDPALLSLADGENIMQNFQESNKKLDKI
jgi:hypothetical protein